MNPSSHIIIVTLRMLEIFTVPTPACVQTVSFWKQPPTIPTKKALLIGPCWWWFTSTSPSMEASHRCLHHPSSFSGEQSPPPLVSNCSSKQRSDASSVHVRQSCLLALISYERLLFCAGNGGGFIGSSRGNLGVRSLAERTSMITRWKEP